MKHGYFAIMVVSVLIFFASPTKAHNNYFLPGDSFWCLSLTESLMENWDQNPEDHFEFTYTRYDNKFMACGNFGFDKLVLEKISKAFKASLTEAYKEFTRHRNPEFSKYSDGKLVQTNGVVALIYNSDFDGPLGLKFNENWVQEGWGKYSGIVNSAEAVSREWKYADLYPPLTTDGDGLDAFQKSISGSPENKSHGAATVLRSGMFGNLKTDAKNIKIILVGFTDFKGNGTRRSCPELTAIFEDRGEWSYTVVEPGKYTRHFVDPKTGRNMNEVTKVN